MEQNLSIKKKIPRALEKYEEIKLKPEKEKKLVKKIGRYFDIGHLKCPICKKPRKKILDGVKNIKNELKAESKDKLIKDTIDQKTQKRVFIEVSEKDIVLGKEIFYKRIEVEYEFKNLDELRRIATINKMRYRKDKRENENYKEGNGYG